MTDIAGPFDGAPWAEAQWSRHAAAWAPSGVYGTPAASTTTGDLPLSVSGLSVGLGAGRAWVRGFGFERTGAAVMQTVSANTHASFNRRDRIVLRRNLATHTLTPVLLTGTPSGTPAAPALTQSETGSWDLPCFSFLAPPSSGTAITGIVDERGWIDPANPGQLACASTAARDANFPAPSEGATCYVVASDAVTLFHDGSWRRLAEESEWVDAYVGDTSYTQNLTGASAVLPGCSASPVVPVGRTLEVDLQIPRVDVFNQSGAFIRLVVDGVIKRSVGVQTGTGVTGAWPVHLKTSVKGTGAAVAISATAYAAGSGARVLGSGDGIPNGGPLFSYRISG